MMRRGLTRYGVVLHTLKPTVVLGRRQVRSDPPSVSDERSSGSGRTAVCTMQLCALALTASRSLEEQHIDEVDHAGFSEFLPCHFDPLLAYGIIGDESLYVPSSACRRNKDHNKT